MNQAHFERAIQMVSQRRQRAIQENQDRLEEVSQRIPEVRELNRQLSKTCLQLLQLLTEGQDISSRLHDMQNQNLEAQSLVRQNLQKYGYPADYLEIHYTCEKCHDTGYLGGHFCTCLEDLCAKIAAEELNQSVRFSEQNFLNFSLDYYKNLKTENGKSCYRAMEAVFLFTKEYAKNFTTASPSLLLFGKTGLGKTHLSLSIAHEVLQKGYSVLYDSAVNFLRQVEKEHFGRGDYDGDTLDSLLGCDLLILDDLGTEFRSSFYQSVIYNIINTRQNRKKPTIISTNLDDNEISRIYDERVTSRMYATYIVLRFVGTDVRLLQKQEAMRQKKIEKPR